MLLLIHRYGIDLTHSILHFSQLRCKGSKMPEAGPSVSKKEWKWNFVPGAPAQAGEIFEGQYIRMDYTLLSNEPGTTVFEITNYGPDQVNFDDGKTKVIVDAYNIRVYDNATHPTLVLRIEPGRTSHGKIVATRVL